MQDLVSIPVQGHEFNCVDDSWHETKKLDENRSSPVEIFYTGLLSSLFRQVHLLLQMTNKVPENNRGRDRRRSSAI